MDAETGELAPEVLAAWREDAKSGSDWAQEPESSRILALIDALEKARETMRAFADDLDGDAQRIADRLRALAGGGDG